MWEEFQSRFESPCDWLWTSFSIRKQQRKCILFALASMIALKKATTDPAQNDAIFHTCMCMRR